MPRSNAAGPIVLSPIGDHRIIIHASRATWSTCTETGTRHLRRAGDIDLVPAGRIGGFAADDACQSLEVLLPPAVLQTAAGEMGHAGGRTNLDMRHMMRNDSIVHLVQSLEKDRDAEAPAGALYVEAIGIALAAQLIGRAPNVLLSREGLPERQLRRLFDFIEAHIDQALTIAMLARAAGASSSHLRHAFKQATGMTVHHYVMQRRVERARQMLVMERLSASEAALAAGFSHQSHMARWMRRELGVTPRQLRTTTSPGSR